MRIARQADTVFRRHGHHLMMPDEEWYEKARLGPNFDHYNIDDHEAAPDAHDLGFKTVQGGWNNRLYKVDDHGVVYEVYPRGHSTLETDEETMRPPRWMLKVSNIPESPDIMARHNTLDDALDQIRDKSWMRNVKRPSYDNFANETKSYPPGTPFITHGFARIMDPSYTHQSGDPREEGTAQGKFLESRDKDIQHFHDAWNQGTHDPYSRQDFEQWG